MNQGTEQPRSLFIKHTDKTSPAPGTGNGFSGILETIRNLFIQFFSVGDDNNTRIINILMNPLCQPNHNQTFATTLRFPYHAAFFLLATWLSCLYGKILARAANLLDSSIKYQKIMNHFQQSFLIKPLGNTSIQFVRNACIRFFPSEPELFGCIYHAII